MKKILLGDFKKIIDEGAAFGLPSIELNGVNEPLLNKHIIECIRYASEKGIMHISMHTNGLLMTEDLSEQIIGSGLTNISFSIDAATKNTYDEIRGQRENDYDRLMENINYFLEVKGDSVFPMTRVSLTRSKLNVEEVEQFKKQWGDKVDEVSTSFFYNPFVGQSKYEQIEEKYRMEYREPIACYQPYQRLFIFNNGNIAPCCSMFGGNIVVGNIYKDEIYDVWNSKTMKILRKEVAKVDTSMKACKDCQISYAGKEK